MSPADTIMQNVMRQAGVYEWYIKEYQTKAYIKGTTRILKSNLLLRVAPEILSFDRKEKQTIMEALINIHYRAPNRYTQEIIALNGTRIEPDDIHERAIQFLNINIYNPTSVNNRYLMPFSVGSHRYYRYYYENYLDTLGMRMHQIRIEPRWESPQLLSARALIVDGVWSVAHLEAKGRYGFFSFNIKIDCGIFNDSFLLPTKIELAMTMNLLGNRVENEYATVFDYTSIVKEDDERKARQKTLDMTEYFNIHTDTFPIVRDSLFWEERRPIPLLPKEKLLYEAKSHRQDSLSRLEQEEWTNRSWNITKMLFEPRAFNYRGNSFSYSGFLNPLKVGYSSNRGLSYSQKLKLQRHFSGSDRELGFYPDVGYLFKRKEVIAHLPVNWLYQPRRMGRLSLAAGMGNRGLDSRTINRINEHLRDSAFTFNDFMEYYKDMYAEIKNSIEVSNGLTFSTGAAYHYRKPVSSSKSAPELRVMADDEDTEIMRNSYLSFEPSVSATWNPGQYYRMIGKKKMYVMSFHPTFSLEYTRGLKGVLGSEGSFERMEFDVQQRIPFRHLSSLQYYAGAGVFTNSDDLYFVTFNNFTRYNFPESWTDKIGGAFHLLDDYWYYSSKSYLQLHVMYESPFFIMNFMKNVSRHILSERIYVSQLYLPDILPSYTEVGYGIGNFLVNVGVFASFEQNRFQRFGVRFAFELFH